MKNDPINPIPGCGAIAIGLTKREYFATLSKMQAKLPVGTCFSNGLFFEKIIEIRTSKVLKQKEYVTIGFIRGKKRAPGTTASWLVDKDAVVVDDRYCQ